MRMIFTAEKNWRRLPESICVPQGFKDEQAILIALKYLDNHPESLHLEQVGSFGQHYIRPSLCPI